VKTLRLQFTKPNAADKPMLDRLARIGIAPGQPWEPAKMSPEVRKAIQDSIADAGKELEQQAGKTKTAVGLFGDRRQMGKKSLACTMGVLLGIFGNVPQQAIYFAWEKDADGDPVDTSKHK
jgi:hypothetical protein